MPLPKERRILVVDENPSIRDDFAKYESGNLSIDRVSFSLSDLAENCIRLLKPLIEGNGVSCSFTCDSALPRRIFGDPSLIRQVILNLLDNAVKFGRRQNVDLCIEIEETDGNGPRVLVTVSDTGIGMEAETLGKLFTPFMQAENDIAKEYGGTGLGLAICRILVEAMKGSIRVQSERGRGTTLTVELPLLTGPEVVEVPPEIEETSRETPSGGKRRALLVDDNHVNCKLASHFLAKCGLDVVIAENGAESVRRFESDDYDIVLMDLQMPVMDGLEASRRLRETERRLGRENPTPIVALTANAFPEVHERCREAGMDAVLTKPMRMKELSKILSVWLRPASA